MQRLAPAPVGFVYGDNTAGYKSPGRYIYVTHSGACKGIFLLIFEIVRLFFPAMGGSFLKKIDFMWDFSKQTPCFRRDMQPEVHLSKKGCVCTFCAYLTNEGELCNQKFINVMRVACM